jgi:putative transposase
LGLKDFAVVHNGEEVTKYSSPRHLKGHEKNRRKKQQKFAHKTKGSKARKKFKKLVAKVHERVSNTRQDFLHKLSRKLVDKSQVILAELRPASPIVVENLNVKGMVGNRKLSKAISDSEAYSATGNASLRASLRASVGWGMFVNFLAYKLERKEGKLVEIDRFFPSSQKCSCCGHVVSELVRPVLEKPTYWEDSRLL